MRGFQMKWCATATVDADTRIPQAIELWRRVNYCLRSSHTGSSTISSYIRRPCATADGALRVSDVQSNLESGSPGHHQAQHSQPEALGAGLGRRAKVESEALGAIAGGVRGTGGGAGAAGAGAGKGGGACSWQSHSTRSYSNCRVVQFAHTMCRMGHKLHGLIVADGASQCTQA